MTTKLIKAVIEEMPADKREACLELAEHIRRSVSIADRDVAINAAFLVCFELKEASEQNGKLTALPDYQSKPPTT